jgi:hypothetical protein
MINLARYFENPFDTPKVSLASLLAFTTDHLQRMLANNPGGVFTARITGTTAALNAINSSAVDDSTKLGVRKARKQSKRAFRKALPERLAKIQAQVVAKFGGKSPVIAQCFPSGREGVKRAPDDTLEAHLSTLVTGVTAHAAALEPEALTEAEALRTDWRSVYSASESSSGVKASAEQAKRAARALLQRELFLNLLALATQFPCQPEQLGLYMQQSLLRGGR